MCQSIPNNTKGAPSTMGYNPKSPLVWNDSCNVAGNSRMWWQSFDCLIRHVVNDHCNNIMKCTQNAYYGKCSSLFGNSCGSNMCFLPILTALRQDNNTTLDVAKCLGAMQSIILVVMKPCGLSLVQPYLAHPNGVIMPTPVQ
jgi:hypothetical protein